MRISGIYLHLVSWFFFTSHSIPFRLATQTSFFFSVSFPRGCTRTHTRSIYIYTFKKKIKKKVRLISFSEWAKEAYAATPGGWGGVRSKKTALYIWCVLSRFGFCLVYCRIDRHVKRLGFGPPPTTTTPTHTNYAVYYVGYKTGGGGGDGGGWGIGGAVWGMAWVWHFSFRRKSSCGKKKKIKTQTRYGSRSLCYM